MLCRPWSEREGGSDSCLGCHMRADTCLMSAVGSRCCWRRCSRLLLRARAVLLSLYSCRPCIGCSCMLLLMLLMMLLLPSLWQRPYRPSLSVACDAAASPSIVSAAWLLRCCRCCCYCCCVLLLCAAAAAVLLPLLHRFFLSLPRRWQLQRSWAPLSSPVTGAFHDVSLLCGVPCHAQMQ